MTHRYRRYADKVGIRSSLKELRHYSATQLLASGVDLNTVAGRLGHAEGSTTLKFYAQFSRPADRQAAAVIPPSLTDSARRNGSASSTASTLQCPVTTSSPPWPRSSVLRLGLTNRPLLCGSQSSQSRTEHLGVNEWHRGRWGSLPQAESLFWSHEVGAGRIGCCTYLLYRCPEPLHQGSIGSHRSLSGGRGE